MRSPRFGLEVWLGGAFELSGLEITFADQEPANAVFWPRKGGIIIAHRQLFHLWVKPPIAGYWPYEFPSCRRTIPPFVVRRF